MNILNNLFGFNPEETNFSSDSVTESKENSHHSTGSSSPSSKRTNVFDNPLIYYHKCRDLEDQVGKLHRIIQYLLNQVRYYSSKVCSPFNQIDDNINLPTLPTCKSELSKLSVSSSIQKMLRDSFSTMEEIFDASSRLKTLKEQILGKNFDLEETFQTKDYANFAYKMVDLQINSVIILSEPAEINISKQKSLKRVSSVGAMVKAREASLESDFDIEDSIDEVYHALEHKQNHPLPRNKAYYLPPSPQKDRIEHSETESSLSCLMKRCFNK